MEICFESLCRYVGQTVTIFTTSGGLSGSGFTGVLMSIDCNAVTLLVSIGAAPSCAVGSPCNLLGGGGGCGCGCGRCQRCCGGGCAGGYAGGSPLGAITVIPICAIAAFTHNAIA